MSWLTFIMVLFANFTEGSARIMFDLNWVFARKNNIAKNITKCSLWLFVTTLQCSRPPAKFLPHSPNSFRLYFNVKSHWKYSCKNKSRKFGCIFLSMALKVLGKLIASSFPRAISQTTSYFVSFRRKTSGLQVTIPSSRIFRVTGLTLLPGKFKFTFRILA